MSTYTVTITPDVPGGAEATVHLAVERGIARVTEFAVRPAGGMAISDKPSSVDFDLLIRAVGPAVTAIEAIRPEAEGRGPARGRRAAAASPTPTKMTRRGRTARSTAGRRASTGQSGSRAYRRMPDDLAQTFAEIGSVTALAAHYDVPRHTAQGWVNRLRRAQAA